MLPFLKPKKMASTIIANYKKDEVKPSHEEGEHPPELMKAAEDCIGGFHSKDAKAVVDAMTRMHRLITNPNEPKDS